MKYRKLYNHCFIAKELKDKDQLPVLQETGIDFRIKKDGAKKNVVLDFENLDFHVKKIIELTKKIDLEKLSKWAKQSGLTIDTSVLRTLIAFTKYTETKLFGKKDLEKEKKRKDFYDDNEKVYLSEIFSKNLSMCVEKSAFTQYFLQKVNIKSNYFNGYINKNEKILESHAFIYLEDHDLILDPTNSINKNSINSMPNLLKITKHQKMQFDKLCKTKAVLLEGKSIYSDKTELYGVSSSKYKIVDKPKIIEKDFYKIATKKAENLFPQENFEQENNGFKKY